MTATDLTMPVLGGHRVLVLDSDSDSAATMTAVLRLNGFDARVVQTITEALAAIRVPPSPVLILDPSQVLGDWRKFIRRVKNAPGASVVVLTGDTDPRTKRAATEAGAAAFFLKPAEPEELVKRVQQLVAAEAA